jgi:hypothetical protein
MLKREKLKMNMRKTLQNIKKDLETRLVFRRRISKLSRINIRRYKRYTKERWVICRKD